MNDEPLESLAALAGALVERARRAGADVAEVITRSGSELSVKVRGGEVELVEEAGHRSAGMRVMKGKRVGLTSTSDLSEAGLERFVADALELAELAEEDPFAGPAAPEELAKGPFADLALYDPAVLSVDASSAIRMARAAEDAARRADPRITNSEGASFTRAEGGVALVLSGGFCGTYRATHASLHVAPLAEDAGGKKRRGSYDSSARFLADLADPAAVGEEAARRTVRKLGARKIPTCEAPVVFDPEVSRSIVGALLGCVMGGAVYRKSSYLAERQGTAVASPLVTLTDDPLVPRGFGSRPFDGEGLTVRPNVIVERGVLKTFLCDTYAARKLGRRSTASATRGASGGVGASTSNVLCEAGTGTLADILRQTERGLYVTETMGFGFNPVTGDFSRGAGGFWIERGELAHPVGEVTISLNLDALLRHIDRVGADLDRRRSIVTPTLRVASMTIAGA